MSAPVFAIAFDFPDTDDPVFAGYLTRGEPMGFALTLATAARFDTEEIAERVLANSYGEGSKPYGVVVEVDL